MSKDAKSFAKGEQFCEDQYGAHLSEFQNEEQYNLVVAKLRDEKEVRSWWMGADDQGNEGTFVWRHSGKKVDFFHWKANEPNNHHQYFDDDGEDCIELVIRKENNAVWNDNQCSKERAFIYQIN